MDDLSLAERVALWAAVTYLGVRLVEYVFSDRAGVSLEREGPRLEEREDAPGGIVAVARSPRFVCDSCGCDTVATWGVSGPWERWRFCSVECAWRHLHEELFVRYPSEAELIAAVERMALRGVGKRVSRFAEGFSRTHPTLWGGGMPGARAAGDPLPGVYEVRDVGDFVEVCDVVDFAALRARFEGRG